jgi:hypothetical protein
MPSRPFLIAIFDQSATQTRIRMTRALQEKCYTLSQALVDYPVLSTRASPGPRRLAATGRG